MWLLSPTTLSNAHTKDSKAVESPLKGSSEFLDKKSDQKENREKSGLRRGVIYFRSIKPEDRAVIQTLHEEWFPVDYKSDFFDGLCNQRIMPHTNQPLYSSVACFRELDDEEFGEMYEKRERESCSMPLFWSKGKNSLTSKYFCNETNQEFILWNGSSFVAEDESESSQDGTHQTTICDDDTCVPTNDINALHRQQEREKLKRFYSNNFRLRDNCTDGVYQNFTSKDETSDREQKDDNSVLKMLPHENGNSSSCVNDCGEIIIGCIVGCFLPTSMISNKTGLRDETASLLVPDSDAHPEMFYIMTLGTSRRFRRVGLGSMLVNRVVDMVKSKHECGALYLHVITYNETAIKLYERLGFSRVKTIAGYYNINSVEYDCYLYARYFHGNFSRNSPIVSFAKVMLGKISRGLITS